jgi:hypothetical protein
MAISRGFRPNPGQPQSAISPSHTKPVGMTSSPTILPATNPEGMAANNKPATTSNAGSQKGIGFSRGEAGRLQESRMITDSG